MDIFDKILKEHSVILEQEETRTETYEIDDDVEINIQQTKDRIYMYAYRYSTDRTLNMKNNFKRLWKGFEKVAKDNKISTITVYSYEFYLKQEESTEVVIVKEPEQKVEEKQDISVVEDDTVSKLMLENKQLKSEIESLKVELEQCRKVISKYSKLGRKSKLTAEQIEEIKGLNKGGMSIRQLAKMFECSAGLIHKVINS